MPIVMQFLAHKRLLRRWAAPKVVVDFGRNRLRSIDFADARASLVTQPASAKNFANVSFTHPCDAFRNRMTRARLRSRLHNFPILARRFDNLATFPHVMT